MSIEPKFCDGCPFANGVVEGRAMTKGFKLEIPAQTFDVFFEDKDGNQTNSIEAYPVDGIAGDMPRNVCTSAATKFNDCTEPTEVKKKVLGGLLGSKTVAACGAFPKDVPTKIKRSTHSYFREW